MKKFLAVTLLTIIFLSGCGKKDFKRTRILMGTVVEISVAEGDKKPEQIKRAVDKAFEEMDSINKLMSIYRTDSQLSEINRSGKGQMAVVSDELLEVIKKSIWISRLSSGAFDVTLGPVIELWGFGQKGRIENLPSLEQIDKALSMVGYHSIIIDDEEKKIGFAKEGMRIDLGAVAKGYAVDKAIKALKSEGINNALVNAGGDICCLGLNAKRMPWIIGIKDPRHFSRIITTLKLENKACATSGDYENFFLKDGKSFSHLIDPRTGRPVENEIVSVTVLASDCFEADGLATAVFVLGKEKGLKLINSLAGAEAIIISREDDCLTAYFSRGLEKLRGLDE
ncbi:MAG: FAD:protein FMN transferase [Candidatus Omnitrophota bacterium]|nr:FAD:protein FMN transferase [Candidatus Omnitrophota bacterium]